MNQTLITATAANSQPIFPIDVDWSTWLAAMFPGHFTSEFAPHHHELWQWLWNIQLGDAPEPGAFIAIWPRGAGKSTNAEAACACFAARLTRRYGLYVSGTQSQADKHVQTVAAMLGAEAVESHYPDAARRKVNKYGHALGWRRNRLHTQSGASSSTRAASPVSVPRSAHTTSPRPATAWKKSGPLSSSTT